MERDIKTCWVVDLGVVAYAEGVALQRRLVAARKAGAVPDVLLVCQHPPVITLGRSARREHLLAAEHVLRQMGVEVTETDRGGDITYHGPGQLVGYPILNLAAIRKDVVWYVRQLEEAMIRATLDFGIRARRVEGRTGIWVDTPSSAALGKLGAIGVHISRWVTSHGFAYNVSTDLRCFEWIVPCGISECRAVSLELLLDRAVDFRAAAERMSLRFGEVFGFEMRGASRPELEERLAAGAPAMVPAHA